MRMAELIRANIEPILQKWEEFAVTILPAGNMNKGELRDHAKEMLLVIAEDIESSQTDLEQSDKSKGLKPLGAGETAAQEHGVERLAAGFSINEAISEYRALRASVIRLWANEASRTLHQSDVDDLIRFNDAIDQSLDESLASYTIEKEMQTRLFGTILSASPDQIYTLDLDGRFMYVNKATGNLYRMRPEAMVGKTHFDLGFPFAADLQNHIHQVIKTNEIHRGEISYPFASGLGERFEYILAPVMGESSKVEAIVAIARDITERKAAEEKSWHNANFDLLTGLPNRRLFRDRLEQDVKHAERNGLPIAVLFIYLDRFKEVNDALGHDAGDSLLRQVAERLNACVRVTDTVARLGGDEFTVVLTELTERKHVGVVAQKIIDELARPFHILENIVHISGSIGITHFPQDATTPEDLVRNADQAMSAAKAAGRNRVSLFTPDIQKGRLTPLGLIGDLRNALSEQQLAVYYQPIVDLSDGRVIKAEALLRWLHPERGLVFPDEFIGLAEETGFIIDIGNWVFSEAAAHVQKWGALSGSPFQVSINASPMQFMDRARAINWDTYLRTLGLAGHSLSVEVSEDALLNASTMAVEKLCNLHKAGFDLTIDHFGTGYCSIAYLKKFHVDYLKIDQSLVQDTANDPSKREIAETVIMMAHKLGLKVIGKGVETVEQRDWLKDAGCDYAQGYLFSEAIPSDEFEKLLSA